MARLFGNFAYVSACSFFVACQTLAPKTLKNEVPHGETRSPTTLIFESSLSEIRQEPLDFEKEFLALKIAIVEFRESDVYKTPKNDDERYLRITVDLLDHLTRQDLKSAICTKRFAMFEERMRNIQELEGRARAIAAELRKDSGSEVQTDNAEEGLNLAERTTVQYRAGLQFLVMGSLAASLGAVAYKKGVSPRVSGGLMLAASPFIVLGAMIVADESSSTVAVKTTQVFSGTAAVVAGIAGLYSFGFMIDPETFTKVTAVAFKRLSDAKHVKATPKIGPEDFMLKVAKEKISSYEKVGKRIAGGLGGLLFTSMAINLAAWTYDMGLTQKEIAPELVLISKVARSYVTSLELGERETDLCGGY